MKMPWEEEEDGAALLEGSTLDQSVEQKVNSADRGNTTSGTYSCTYKSTPLEVVSAAGKGIALDDTTFESCSNKIPVTWPLTKEPVKSIRLFKPWGLTAPKIFHANLSLALDDLVKYAKAHNAAYLVGISVTCNEKTDQTEWDAGMKLLRMLGPEHVMGLAVGNEVDWNMAASVCRNDLFQGGKYLERFKARVADLDSIPGMSEKPLTAVLSDRYGLDPGSHNANFVNSLWEIYGTRYVASFNVYPQFSNGLAMAGCKGAVDVGTKFTMDEPGGFVPSVVKHYREKIAENKWDGMKLWVTETGWATEAYCALGCIPACNGHEPQEKFYKQFLDWDLSAGEDAKADHVFFFTIRDSSNFGFPERFGVIKSCQSEECKFE
jgi:exo-beta-1,3-glucanase (GH17 family)